MELPKFTVGDEQNREHSPTRLSAAAQIDRSNASSPRRQGIQLSIPIQSSPMKNYEINDGSSINNSVTTPRNSFGSDFDRTGQMEQNQDLLYKLAAKKRQIVELQQGLELAKKELHILESRYKLTLSPDANPNYSAHNDGAYSNSSTKAKNEKLQPWQKRMQQTLADVNNSPNVLKSKQSISSFFNNDAGSTKQLKQDLNENTAKPTFFQSILDKFNEFSVAEEEEEEFDRTQNQQKDSFYLKDKLDYDEEEEIENEETGHTLIGNKSRSKNLM